MKLFKKMLTFVLVAIMSVAMGATSVFAQDVGQDADGKGSITIENAARGETYSVVKIFGATLTSDATATTDASGIAYTGEIPDALTNFFTKDSVGNVIKKTNVVDTELIAAVQAYAKTQTATASIVSDGSVLTFRGLDYGYYAVISTQGAVVTIDSTMPNVKVYDKNTTIPSADKTVGATSYSIGDTITYTAVFDTANYLSPENAPADGSGAKQVTKYEISDTLPEFLSNVAITSVTIVKPAAEGQQETVVADLSSSYTAFTDKKITIPWAVEDEGSNPKTYTSKYPNGVQIKVVYTAKLTSTSNVNGANTNTITIKPYVYDGEEKPWNEEWHDDEVVRTYGAALKKVDSETKNPLKGAKFKVKGLTVEPVTGEPGVYKVVTYNAASTELGTEMTTNNDGKLYIIGLVGTATLKATETEAPQGYNKAAQEIDVPAQVLTETLYETSGERYYDAKGNLVSESSEQTTTKTVEKNYTMLDAAAVEVVNQKGTELPSTGGIGTTIFYVLGGLLVAGAGIVLVARRKASE